MEREELGDYLLTKQIGYGTLGRVYAASNRYTKQSFILKVLPEELAKDREFLQRFKEEIVDLAAIDHPHLVKIHNVSSAEGVFFLIANYIADPLGESINLAQYLAIQSSPLSEEKVYKILCQVAEALDFLHQEKRGGKFPLLHGSLKLNNILVEEKEGELCVYLSDYGLARILGIGTILSRTYHILAESLGIIPALYPTSQKHEGGYSPQEQKSKKLSALHTSFLQTYSFLSPEQKRLRDPDLISPATDVYAFGILSYYLLTYHFPEGCFAMPSDQGKRQAFAWDTLIRSTLSPFPNKRVLPLSNLMKQISQKTFPSKNALQSTATVQKMQSLSTQQNNAPAQGSVPITEMVAIPEGMYFRGSDFGNRDERPRHSLFVPSFSLDIHPVTNEQFICFLEAMGGEEKDRNNQDMIRLRDSRIKRRGGKLTIESGYAKHPVVGVSWYGAVAYAKWIEKRLPSEIEWEIAASGGKESFIYPTGEKIEKSQANFFSSDTTPVMSYSPNPFGLYDMAGNVYEWCKDWYHHKYRQDAYPMQGQGPGISKAIRGGCWKSSLDDLPCAKRHKNNPGTMNSTYGFRCAR